jgi:hypothetical protein
MNNENFPAVDNSISGLEPTISFLEAKRERFSNQLHLISNCHSLNYTTDAKCSDLCYSRNINEFKNLFSITTKSGIEILRTAYEVHLLADIISMENLDKYRDWYTDSLCLLRNAEYIDRHISSIKNHLCPKCFSYNNRRRYICNRYLRDMYLKARNIINHLDIKPYNLENDIEI